MKKIWAPLVALMMMTAPLYAADTAAPTSPEWNSGNNRAVVSPDNRSYSYRDGNADQKKDNDTAQKEPATNRYDQAGRTNKTAPSSHVATRTRNDNAGQLSRSEGKENRSYTVATKDDKYRQTNKTDLKKNDQHKENEKKLKEKQKNEKKDEIAQKLPFFQTR